MKSALSASSGWGCNELTNSEIPPTERRQRTHKRTLSTLNAVVTCEIKLFQNYFSLRRRSSEIILPKIISKLYVVTCEIKH